MRRRFMNLTGTLHDSDLLICTICYKNLQSPIFQCSFGDVFCESCIRKIRRDKCPRCQLDLGRNRCVVLERFIREVRVACPFSANCPLQIEPHNLRDHQLYGCVVSECFCPNHRWCGVKGSSEYISNHFVDEHWLDWENATFFKFGEAFRLIAEDDLGLWMLYSWTSEFLFAYRCYWGEEGMVINVECLAPISPEDRKFSYLFRHVREDGETFSDRRQIGQTVQFLQDLPQSRNSTIIPKAFTRKDELEFQLIIYKN